MSERTQVDRLEENRSAVLDRVARTARECGRDPADIRLVAVTKTVGAELARALVELGTEDLGENRVTGLEEKRAALASAGLRPRWHFIGHVQRNKARRVVRLADVIHSVDSPRLVESLARLAREEDARPGLFVQAKLAEEESKSGAPRDEFLATVHAAARSGLPLLGLMTMAPLPVSDEARTRAAARAVFDELARLAGELPGDAFEGGRPLLSMGMSGDFEEAIRAGAHVLRVGSALFEGVANPTPAGEAY